MLHFYRQTSSNEEEVEKLETLVTNYMQRAYGDSTKKEAAYTEVISRVERDGVEEVTILISNGPMPKHLDEQEAISPDGKRRLHIV